MTERISDARHTAALQAEVDALRAEVERLTLEMGCLQQQYDERTACMIVHRGSALACSDAVRTAYYDELRRADNLRAEVDALLEERDALKAENDRLMAAINRCQGGSLIACCISF